MILQPAGLRMWFSPVNVFEARHWLSTQENPEVILEAVGQPIWVPPVTVFPYRYHNDMQDP